MPTTHDRSRSKFGTLRVSLFACALLAFGLLLWARLILVTGTPRTAIAEPASSASQQTPAPEPARPIR